MGVSRPMHIHFGCAFTRPQPAGGCACTSLHWAINPSTSRRAAHAAGSGGVSKGTPEMEKGCNAVSAQTLLLSMQVGHHSLGARRLRQTFNERNPRQVDACGGSAGAANKK